MVAMGVVMVEERAAAIVAMSAVMAAAMAVAMTVGGYGIHFADRQTDERTDAGFW